MKLAVLLSLSVTPAVAACSSSPATGTGATSSGTGGSPASASSSSTTHPTSTSSTGTGGQGGATSTSTGNGGGKTCGGIVANGCPSGQYCVFGGHTCGDGDTQGVCTPIPLDCDGVLTAPVCACDARYYANACLASLNAVDVAAMPACTVPGGDFLCGASVCHLSTQYCLAKPSPQNPNIELYGCQPLPAGCGGSPACACLSAEPCGDHCAGQAAGGLTLTCP